MRRNIPKSDLDKATEDQKKIYLALDKLVEFDIHIFKDNNVMIIFRLGNKILGQEYFYCEIKNNKVKIYEKFRKEKEELKNS